MSIIDSRLTSINSFGEFDALKQNPEFFEDVVRTILARHNLPLFFEYL
ncbi:hypothetical protein J2N86_15385 (plasmid) [Legionella lytica]|uniref:Uncharacterized protein n=1 Tax=Legionella lytica TaxID=96232 RepID=A0ABY4YCF8_9GAMM|nr:hypothetical protein [Legionella lytica]USQ15342.1 hypothetical protein J2N86_15385 [Legionella lytica]